MRMLPARIPVRFTLDRAERSRKPTRKSRGAELRVLPYPKGSLKIPGPRRTACTRGRIGKARVHRDCTTHPVLPQLRTA